MRRFLGVLAVVWMSDAGCAVTAPRPLPRVDVDSSAAIRMALSRESAAPTLRARFHTVAAIDGSERTAEGVLVVARPRRFRLRLFSSFGLSFFDYLEDDGRSWLSLPSAPGQDASESASSLFAPSGLGAIFLGRRDVDLARCAIGATARCDDGDGVVEIDLEHAVVLSETRRSPSGAEIQVSYSDHRAVDAVVVPFRIVIVDPSHRLTLRIDVDRYEINPVLGDALFTPPPSAKRIAPVEAPAP